MHGMYVCVVYLYTYLHCRDTQIYIYTLYLSCEMNLIYQNIASAFLFKEL